MKLIPILSMDNLRHRKKKCAQGHTANEEI